MSHPFSGSPVRNRRRGMALVVTLCIIVLVTIAVVAFFSRATANRGVESSRVNQILVDQLATTATDYVASQFLGEIADPANSTPFTATGSSPIYQPKESPAGSGKYPSMLPDGSKRPSFATAGSNFENLLRQSVSSSDPNASGVSTSQPARTGRTITPARWDAPKLTSAGFTSAQLPAWIYVQRDGNFTATPTAMDDANPTVGRFAYNAYDLGGLLDVNVVGYPTTLTGNSVLEIKPSLAGLDVTNISPSLGITIDQLVAWRNPTSGNYTALVRNQASQGFLTPLAGDQLVPTRQDLIQLAGANKGIPASALPGLTHFSRAVNAPSAPAVSASNLVNPFLANLRVTTAFTRRDGTEARVGDLLLNRRFPLRKLDLLTATATAASGSDIERYFGLTRSNPGDSWTYRGGAISILTLDQVAAAGRDPDFFELLKAGVADGSVGKPATFKTLAANGNQALEGDNDLQILRIGANLIDQWDNDNLPTRIASGSATQIGVEDLPYLYMVMVANCWQSTPLPAPPNSYNVQYALVLAPKLFNPHGNSTVANSPDATLNPQNIRIRMSGFFGPTSFSNYNSSGSASPLNLTAPTNVGTLPAIEIPRSSFEFFRSAVRVPQGATGQIKSQISWWNQADPSCGFVLYQRTSDLLGITLTGGSPQGWFAFLNASGMMMVAEYQSSSGQWVVYDSLAGNADLPDTTGITATNTENWSTGVTNFTIANGTKSLPGTSQHFITKWDPRSNRWGPSHGWGTGPDDNPSTNSDPIVRRTLPFDPPETNTTLGMYPERSGSLPSPDKVVPGLDNISRPNDAWRGNLSQKPNPFRRMSDMNRRPTILQRPFRSVAEMGYAFRDTPWQTLSFFDQTSGDATLLDLFSLEDEPGLTAGKLNLNVAGPSVLTALFSNVPKAADGTGATLANPAGLAANLAAFRTAEGGALVSRSRLAAFLSSSSLTQENAENVKSRREAIVRAVADVADTRTWNLLVDVIAQSGRFPADGGTAAGDFVVEAEQRVWSSVAIDRYLGRVVARQTERVSE